MMPMYEKEKEVSKQKNRTPLMTSMLLLEKAMQDSKLIQPEDQGDFTSWNRLTTCIIRYDLGHEVSVGILEQMQKCLEGVKEHFSGAQENTHISNAITELGNEIERLKSIHLAPKNA